MAFLPVVCWGRGSGWAIGLSFVAVLFSLVLMDPGQLTVARHHQPALSLREGLRFLGERTALGLLVFLAGVIWPSLSGRCWP